MIESLRSWINNNNAAAAAAAIAAVILVAVASLIWRNGSGRAETIEVWFYEPGSGKLFVGNSAQLPPIRGPDGAEAVRAHRFGCGSCAKERVFTGYYEKFNPETRQKLQDQRISLGLRTQPLRGRFISADAKQWHEDGTREARRILDAVAMKCTDLLQCLPEDESP